MTHHAVVIKQARILDPVQNMDQVSDLWIEDGRIKALAPNLDINDPHTPSLPGTSWVIGPGLVDLYAQSGEPGFEQRETIASLVQSAQAGGYHQVAILPTTNPALTHLADLQAFQQHSSPVELLPLAALTTDPKHLADLGELAQTPMAGFCGLPPIQSPLLLQRILDYLQPFQCPLLLWPWDPTQVEDGLIYEGVWALRLGLKGIPATAETTMVAIILELLRRTPRPIHLIRISQARSLTLIAQAQAEGLPVTASTTWMHLLLNDQAIATHHYHPSLRLLPPLGDQANQQALQQGLARGVLIAIATDHHPYTFEEKAVPFGEALPGAIGLELALPLLWDQLVNTHRLPALTLWSALTTGPATCLNRSLPQLTVGAPAHLTILDLAQSWTLTPTTLKSKSAATPWLHQTLQGKVIPYPFTTQPRSTITHHSQAG